MDDDLDYTNDLLLRRLQAHRQEIDRRLTQCRDGMQATVDQISHIEQSREVERIRIEKEFEKARLQMLYLLDKRRKHLLKSLDAEVDAKRAALLRRVHVYQRIIVEAAELQPEISKLEAFELNNNQHIQCPATAAPSKPSVTQFLQQSKAKLLAKSLPRASTSPPRSRPPPPPASVPDSFVSVPSPSLHNLPVDGVEAEQAEYCPTSLSKQRLMQELSRFLSESTVPLAHKPTVRCWCDGGKLAKDVEARLWHFGRCESSTGSLSRDLHSSLSVGMSWVARKTGPLVSLVSQYALRQPARRSEQLQTMPPPLLIVFLDAPAVADMKPLAEQFAEALTLVTSEAGVVISVLARSQAPAIARWLDPHSLSMRANNKHSEDDYAYNPDLEQVEAELASSGNRSVLRSCLVLYDGERHCSRLVNRVVEEYAHSYELASICGVELKRVSQRPPRACDVEEDCPHCYVGNIFYEADSGIVEGQQSMLESIAKCVFSPNTDEFEDEINAAMDAYDVAKVNVQAQDSRRPSAFQVL